MTIQRLQWMVFSSLMAALTAAGAYIHIPIGPVPIVLQNFFVLLSGLLLGGRKGVTSIGIYLLAGAIGMPVFAGGKGGIAHFLSPTGGYLLGFALAAFVTGTVSERSKGHLPMEALAVLLGSLAIYSLGIPWLKLVTGMSWQRAFMVGFLPFLLGDVLKACTAIVLARSLRPLVNRQLETVSQ